MTEERGFRSVMDPTDLWRQWYETSTKLWSDAARGAQSGYANPADFYRQWFDSAREMQERMIGSAPGAVPGAVGGNAGVQDTWQRWSEASTATWQKSTELGQNALDLLPRWTQMLEEARDNLLAGGNLPVDPLQFATRWYNATSGPFSDFVGDAIEREEFLEPSSQFLQSYAGFYKVFKRNSEEYLKGLQLPVRSDISRVAGLVINLEDKVDRIEEVLEDLGDATATAAIETPEAASAESVKALEDRLDSVESKLDRVLAALENTVQNGGTSAARANAGSNGAASAEATTDAEVEATDAARRKAREMGVELASVEGTGTDGKVTVEDVRKKGDS